MFKKSSDQILSDEEDQKLERRTEIADFLGTYIAIGFPLAVLIVWTITTLAGC